MWPQCLPHLSILIQYKAYLKLYIITHNALLTIYSNNQSINNQSAQNAWDAQLAPDYFQTKNKKYR